MKQVFEISVKGEFKQFLMKSEVKYIKDMCLDFGEITIKLVEISIAKYKLEFGK